MYCSDVKPLRTATSDSDIDRIGQHVPRCFQLVLQDHLIDGFFSSRLKCSSSGVREIPT